MIITVLYTHPLYFHLRLVRVQLFKILSKVVMTLKWYTEMGNRVMSVKQIERNKIS